MGQKNTEVIAVSSGKGGVGKTTLAVNLGIALAQQGKRVCLFDADTNLANINIMLRESPQFTLQHVLDGEKAISEIIIQSNGISFIPGASGVTAFNELGQIAQDHLLQALNQLENQYDVILVDTAAGIHDNVLEFILAADQCMVLITPEPTSLTDAFSLLRMMRKRKFRKRINIVVNQAISELGARQVFKRFSSAVSKYIGYHPVYFGYVSRDDIVSSAVCSQVPVRVYRPDSVSSRCFDRLADNLVSLFIQSSGDKCLSDKWRRQASLPATETLPQTVSSPVPGGRPVSQTVVNMPSSVQIQNNQRQQEKYRQDDRARKKQVLEDHKRDIVDYIEDPDFGKEEIALTLDKFLNVFFKRFKDYPSDIVEQINFLLQMNVLPQAKINQLLSVLMLFYKDNHLRVDRDYSAEILNQQIDDYIDEYGQYPFDTIQVLMQSIGMGQVSAEAMMELDNILNLVGKSNPPSGEIVKAPTVEVKEPEKASQSARTLKDSISFASKVDD